MTDSILDSTKKAVGLDPEYDVFDLDITMHINSVFSVLHQLGVGPVTPFFIEDKTKTWKEFLDTDPGSMMAVKSLMFLKVRLLFDPPTTSFALDAMNKTATEYEWRLHVSSEGAKRAEARAAEAAIIERP